MLVEATDFKNKISKALLVMLVTVIAGLGSIFFVLVRPMLSSGTDN